MGQCSSTGDRDPIHIDPQEQSVSDFSEDYVHIDEGSDNNDGRGTHTDLTDLNVRIVTLTAPGPRLRATFFRCCSFLCLLCYRSTCTADGDSIQDTESQVIHNAGTESMHCLCGQLSIPIHYDVARNLESTGKKFYCERL